MSGLTVISLGGGVQSTVLALMAGAGTFDRIPDCAIFADTKWEPPSIYAHLEWLATQLPFPLHIVDNGRSLREDVKALINHSDSPNYVDIPGAPRSAQIERSRWGTRPGVCRWLGKQAWRPEAVPCLKPSRQCGGDHPTEPRAASQSVVTVTQGTAV